MWRFNACLAEWAATVALSAHENDTFPFFRRSIVFFLVGTIPAFLLATEDHRSFLCLSYVGACWTY